MTRMRYAEHVADLVGNTPLVRLGRGHRGHRGHRAGQGRVLQPRRHREGPDRAADDRGRRGVRRAAARRHDRRADLAATPASGWPWSPSARATGACSSARTRSARTSATCCGPTAPRSWSARPRSRRSTRTPTTTVSDRLVARDRRAPGSPTSTPTRRTRESHYETHRPGALGARPRAGSPTSWPASAPAARSPAPGATSRRSPTAGSRSSAPTRRARCTPAAPAGRTWSRASARTSGRAPTTARSATRSSRCPTPTRSR